MPRTVVPYVHYLPIRLNVTRAERARSGVLTEREEAVLRYIDAFKRAHDYSPSYIEIGRGCQISSTSVIKHYMAQLVAAGYLLDQAGQARTCRLTFSGRLYLVLHPMLLPARASSSVRSLAIAGD